MLVAIFTDLRWLELYQTSLENGFRTRSLKAIKKLEKSSRAVLNLGDFTRTYSP